MDNITDLVLQSKLNYFKSLWVIFVGALIANTDKMPYTLQDITKGNKGSYSFLSQGSNSICDTIARHMP